MLLLQRLTVIISDKQWQIAIFLIVKNTNQISAKPNFRAKCAQKISMKSTIFYQLFFEQNLSQKFPQISHEISLFLRKIVSEIPAKFDFFSITYQKPCLLQNVELFQDISSI